MIQEPKDFPAVVAEVLRQPLVGRIDFGAKNRGKKVEFQSRSSDLQTVSADLTRQASVTQVQGAVEDVLHGAWKTDRATGGCGENLLTAIQKMPQALLMFRVEELIVCRPTVMNHDARVIEAEECLRHRTTSRRVNDIGRRVRGHKTMQPGGKSTDTPTGLVGDDPGGGTHGAATVGTGVGQRRFDNFVDRFGRLAMGFDAIVLTRLAARFLRRPFRRPLRERRRLTLAGPNRFFQLVHEPCHPRFQLSDPTLELDNPLVAFKTSLATNGVHARMLAPQLNCSCASLQKNRSWQRGRRYSNTCESGYWFSARA